MTAVSMVWQYAIPSILRACPSCYGAADAPMTEGMNMAILSLLGVTGGVLISFISFFMHMRKRAGMLMNRSSRF